MIDFPLNANLKIDLKAFPDPPINVILGSNDNVNEQSSIPVNSVMSIVIETYERTVGVKPGALATFSAVGIDSITGIMFIKRLSSALNGRPLFFAFLAP